MKKIFTPAVFAVAIIAATAAEPAAALSVNYGTITPASGPIAFGNTVLSGDIDDAYSFNTAIPTWLLASLSYTSTTLYASGLPLAYLGRISSAVAMVDGQMLPSVTTSADPPITGSGFEHHTSTKTYSYSWYLPPGQHMITFSGEASGTAAYTGQLQASAVPEPETYAMLLAGLCAVGWLSARGRRRAT